MVPLAGMCVSLDDFGTGYSLLADVHMLRADTIKIDRSFVDLLPDDSEAPAIVLSTIALAKGLHVDDLAILLRQGPFPLSDT